MPMFPRMHIRPRMPMHLQTGCAKCRTNPMVTRPYVRWKPEEGRAQQVCVSMRPVNMPMTHSQLPLWQWEEKRGSGWGVRRVAMCRVGSGSIGDGGGGVVVVGLLPTPGLNTAQQRPQIR